MNREQPSRNQNYSPLSLWSAAACCCLCSCGVAPAPERRKQACALQRGRTKKVGKILARLRRIFGVVLRIVFARCTCEQGRQLDGPPAPGIIGQPCPSTRSNHTSWNPRANVCRYASSGRCRASLSSVGHGVRGNKCPSIAVELLPPKSLPRSEGKSQRVIDKRKPNP